MQLGPAWFSVWSRHDSAFLGSSAARVAEGMRRRAMSASAQLRSAARDIIVVA
jgi:hypothetical protein